MVVFDHMECGSMDKIAKEYKDLSYEFIKYSLYIVAKGLRDLHSVNVIHRDIKAKNILYGLDGSIKITDLGCAVQLNRNQRDRETSGRNIGTLNFWAPEMFEGKTYSKEIDVWAYGCFAYELATGKQPFEDFINDHELK